MEKMHFLDEKKSALRMPALFVGHGNPMNAIEDNIFSRGWRSIASALPTPQAILCISAHWETEGVWVTAMKQPRTIHDFGGFPEALYEVQYPAPGSLELAERVQALYGRNRLGLDLKWGLDHGAWSVLKHMFPQADVPVVQLSLDRRLSPRGHYSLAATLAPLREEGVLLFGSGNMVHNLYQVELKGDDFNEPFGFDWALEANELFKTLIRARDHSSLIEYPALGQAVQQAVPTNEHFLPLLYILALQASGEPVVFFNDIPVAGSLTMTSLKIGG